MGNVMTPFSPPQPAIINRSINLLSSGPYVSTFFVDITAAQSQSNIFYISGTATNAGTTGTSAFVYFDLPTTASTKVYTFSAGNITLATTLFSCALSISTTHATTSVAFNPNTTFQVAYSASGYGSAGVPTVKIASATNIPFATT